MVPTLPGRIQTRIVLLAVIGGLVTAILVPLLPVSGPLGARYTDGYLVLAAVAVVGIGWECLYHVLMQWRWEKDWPTLFGLATGVPEGLVVWLLLRGGAIPGVRGQIGLAAFGMLFAVVWVAVWLVANGPLRVPFIRWRFFGGRLV